MPHYCHSAHNILRHTHTHTHTHTPVQTANPKQTHQHIQPYMTHTGYLQLKSKALESTKYHFRAFPPFPMGNPVPGTALCSGNNSTSCCLVGLPRWLTGKESTCQCRRCGFDPWVEKIQGNPLQYSGLGNPMDRGVWWARVHGVTKQSDTT